MADLDEEELAYYQELCERLRACRRTHPERHLFTHTVATEVQLRAVEAKLGFSLPPLLRMIYRDVADGGLGIRGDEHPFQHVTASADLSQEECRKGWRLHPCIERALQRHAFCYVVCDAYPERFLYLSQDSQLSLYLDAATGWIYDSEFEGVLPPRRKGERIDLWSLSFFRGSLWELCEDWLERNRYCPAYLGSFCTRRIVPGYALADEGELTPALLDPSCQEDSEHIWDGLYPGVELIMWSAHDTGMHPSDPMNSPKKSRTMSLLEAGQRSNEGPCPEPRDLCRPWPARRPVGHAP
jgi:hypothetical protein